MSISKSGFVFLFVGLFCFPWLLKLFAILAEMCR